MRGLPPPLRKRMNDAEVRDVFNLIDKDGNGFITAKELGVVLRTLGQNPSDIDLQEMCRYVRNICEARSGGKQQPSSRGDESSQAAVAGEDEMNNMLISYEMFAYLLKAKVHEVEVEEELKAALMVFQIPNKPGLIQWEHLQAALTSWGEKLAPEEMEEVMKDADVAEDGTVVIDEFVRSIMLR